MADQNFGSGDATSKQKGPGTERMRPSAGDTFSRASDAARAAGEQAKRAASDAASGMADSVMGVLNEQIGNGAASAGRLADAMRLAANDLAKESPLLAGAVRTFASNVDDYAGRLENQSIEELTRKASDFTRQQPAMVFGLAALAGFFAFRTFKNAQSVSSPPIQPATQHHSGWDRDNG